jgi:translation initiation factor 1
MAKKKKSDNNYLVYSTNKNMDLNDEQNDEAAIPYKQQDVRIWLEKNHRGGKEVSVIKNYIGNKNQLEELCREIKTKCGTGGSVKNGEILIQGNHREKISELLSSKKIKNKIAGG